MQKKISLKSKINTILKFAKPHKNKFILLFFSIIVTIFTGSFYPYIFGKLVDEVFYDKNMNRFLEIVFIYALLYCFNQFMHFVLNMSWAQLMTKFLFDIKTAMFKKALSFTGEKLASGYSGDMMFRINHDADKFMDFIHVNVFYFIGQTLQFILSVIFIWYHDARLAIISIISTPIIVYTSRFFSKFAKKYYSKITEESGTLSSWLLEIIKGMQDVRLLSASKHVLSCYTKKNISIMRLQMKSSKIELLSERLNSGISIVAQMILYCLSALFIIQGELTVGGFTACVTYFNTCIGTFNSMNNKIIAISKNMASIERVCEVFNEDSEIYNSEMPNVDLKKGEVCFENVSFSYCNNIEVLKGVTFNIKSGEKLSLVGRSGAGKSTIANLLYKLYSANSGNILIDGIDIKKFNLHNLREQIGIVHQESIIFDGTIRFNLLLSNDYSNDKLLWNVLKRVHLYDFIKTLPSGLDTKLGTEGVQLSGGQKQRLVIARIFVKNPKILIFDEATSALDAEAEEIIKQSWDDLCKNRTILIIAHRLSTILTSDKIAVLDEGYIKGCDTHNNLLNNCEIYSELFKEQYSVQEEVNG